jgi:hypothetical protein
MVAIVSCVIAILLAASFVAGWFFALRSRFRQEAHKLPGDDTKSAERAPSAIAEYSDDMDLPAALIGARCKEIIEQLAPILRVTPVNLLREAIAVGLTGGRPVTEEMLDFIEKERKAMGLPPPSKPGPVDPN